MKTESPQGIRFETNSYSIFKTKYDVSSIGETQIKTIKRKTIECKIFQSYNTSKKESKIAC